MLININSELIVWMKLKESWDVWMRLKESGGHNPKIEMMLIKWDGPIWKMLQI